MIWKERNQMIFNNIVAAIDQLLLRIFDEHCNWRMAAAIGLEVSTEY